MTSQQLSEYLNSNKINGQKSSPLKYIFLKMCAKPQKVPEQLIHPPLIILFIRLFLRLLCAGSQPSECEECVAVSGTVSLLSALGQTPPLPSRACHCWQHSTLPSLICLRRSQLTLDQLRQRSLGDWRASLAFSQSQLTFFQKSSENRTLLV